MKLFEYNLLYLQFGDQILLLQLDVTDRAADLAAVKATHGSVWMVGNDTSALRFCGSERKFSIKPY